MKQKVIIVLVIILAIILGIVGYMVYRVVDVDIILNKAKENEKNIKNYVVTMGMHEADSDQVIEYDIYNLNGKIYTNDEFSQIKQYINYNGKSYTFIESNGYKTYSVIDNVAVKGTINPFDDELYKLSFWDKFTKVEIKDVDYLVQNKGTEEYIKCVEVIDRSQKVEDSNIDYYKTYILDGETYEPVAIYQNTGSQESIHEYISIKKDVVTEEIMKLPDINEYEEEKE